MADYEKLGREIEGLARGGEPTHGKLGYIARGAYHVVDPDNPAKYLVRFETGTHVSAFHHNRVLQTPDLPVLVGVNELGQPVILGEDTSRSGGFDGSGSRANSVGPHNHVRGSGREFIIDTWMLKQLRTTVSSGYELAIASGNYLWHGAIEWYAGGTIDISAYAPSGVSTQRWVVIGINPITNALAAVAGDEYLDDTLLDRSRISAIEFVELGMVPLAAVWMRSDLTSLSDYQIEDLRWLAGSLITYLDDLYNVDGSSDEYGYVLGYDGTYWVGTPMSGAPAGAGSGYPAFGIGVVKTLSSGVATTGDDRHLILAAESGTTDDCIEISGLSVGDEVIVRADTGDTVALKHNDGGATDKIILYGGVDFDLSGDITMKLVKTASGKVVQYVDENSVSLGGVDYPIGYIVGFEASVGASSIVTIAPGVCRNAANTYTLIRTTSAGNLSVDPSGTGAGGLDTGSLANNTWYYIWVIAKSSDGTIAGLLSTSASSPSMPSGYDVKRRIGACRTNGSATLYQQYTEAGGGNQRLVLYDEATDASPFEVLSNANISTFTSFTDVDCSAVVPPTSRLAQVGLLAIASGGSSYFWREKGLSNQKLRVTRAGGSTDNGVSVANVPLSAAQVGSIAASATVTDGVYVDVHGYYDNLAPAII